MKLPHSTAWTKLGGFCGSSGFEIHTDLLLCQQYTLFKYTNGITPSINLSNRDIFTITCWRRLVSRLPSSSLERAFQTVGLYFHHLLRDCLGQIIPLGIQ